jgi:arylformamidase
MVIYDISQTLREGIAVWPGDQRYRWRWTMQQSKGDSCNVSSVTMSTHTGTHVDAPFHFDASSADVAGFSLEPFVGPVRVAPMMPEKVITAADLQKLDWAGVERVLFKTRASELPEDRFRRDYVYLAEDGADFLGQTGIKLAGTDAPSVDAFHNKELRSHKILLAHGIAILEGVRLREVPPGDYELICLPLKLEGLDGSPVRAILRR